MCGRTALLLFFFCYSLKVLWRFSFHWAGGVVVVVVHFEVDGNFFWWFSIKQLYIRGDCGRLLNYVRVRVQLSRVDSIAVCVKLQVVQVVRNGTHLPSEKMCEEICVKREFNFHFYGFTNRKCTVLFSRNPSAWMQSEASRLISIWFSCARINCLQIDRSSVAISMQQIVDKESYTEMGRMYATMRRSIENK